MKAITVIIIIVFLVSCNEKKTVEEKTEKLWNAKVVMVNNTQCELDWEERNTSLNELYGIWNDTLSWVTNKGDSCWYGVRFLNRNITLELKPSKVFVKTYSFSDSTLDFVEKGEYFLDTKSTPPILTLAFNPGKDTLFKPGDTMMSASYQIYWPSKNRLALVGQLENDNFKEYEILDFIKNNH